MAGTRGSQRSGANRSGGNRSGNGCAGGSRQGGSRPSGKRQGGQRRDSRRNGLRGNGRDGNRAPRAQRPAGSAAAGRGKGDKHARQGGPGFGSGASLIEGRRAVAEALALGVPVRRALVQQAEGADATLEGLVEQLADAGVEAEEVPASRLDALSSHGAHQGIVIEVAPYRYATIEDVVAASGTGDALVVVLDHVTDEGNFGAIVRSCEVAGASGVVIPKDRSAGVGVGAYKTSAGAVLHLPIAQVPNIASALVVLKEAGFWCVAATEHAERTCWDASLDGRIALVMGSEGSGVSRLVLERADDACRIPQRGSIESLNVAQATTVLAYEWARRTWGSAVGEAPTPDDGEEASNVAW
ncbi:MAG: 23S rRNA (guanosine(2251)-2'-O)-methyltransferase RlmB [Atopobiaceae bacterium]|jgi:23S rRNA (guanosine2251-2'-O)-methyltransferase|nr:23S rRNA (guanosine(2251)-2'-O)-methyltransferase RlmB [Atopobiaceae bacterium]MCH4119760.1 23S rRNA (guanosine(2251)-2'-O)-methyltransferase RlmB [Atopobiaceae bacterium]MCI1318966.1 23S rRNA (guanosine(2251)-2'-O)-methyltransferase RlmB [Atopobiaceae bacterium]MCI1388832.1 23S rRNA (guanosine(2251)-2'-O)-methyltransferase RlmB [Atopobiaceae bacterium]MCI1432548.1 23S rRNA (guanosine(2251)-2'-O)-methyltransferase RlmB [Atopobiaceae bacterium]